MNKLLSILGKDERFISNQVEFQSFFATFILALLLVITNLILIVFFTIQKIPIFINGNIICLVINLLILYLIYRVKMKISIYMISFEISIMSILNTYFLGWDSNMQWYVLIAILPVFLFYNLNNKFKYLYSVFFIFIFAINIYIGVFLSPVISIDKPAFIFWQSLIIISFILILLNVNSWLQGIPSSYYEKTIATLTTESNIDATTNLYNRRYANSFFENSIKKGMYPNYCIAMIDIDNFKKINDTYGHGIGDKVLEFLGKYMTDFFRSSDIVIRWGGEEFLIIFCNGTIESIRPLIAIFIEKLKIHVLEINDDIKINFTVTAGLAQNLNGLSIESVIEESDRLLYIGKNTGKAKVVSQLDDLAKTYVNPTK